MVGPIRFPGSTSGINFDRIIQKIVQAEKTKVQDVQSRIKENETEKSALKSVIGQLSSLKGELNSLASPSLFNSTSVSSSDTSILTASGSNVASTGSFQFTPTQLAQTHNMLSSGFDNPDVKPGSGSISLEVGDGHLDRTTPLDRLNGGSGIDRGKIKLINEDTGNSSTINLLDAVNGKDVVERVNNDSAFNLKLRTDGDRFVIENNTGDVMSIESVGSNTTASDLGINKTVDPAVSTEKVGDQVLTISRDTDLSVLNDGNGVRLKDALADFEIRTKLDDGTGSPETFSVNLSEDMKNLGDVVDAINNAAPDNDGDSNPDVRASVSQKGNGIVLEDTTGANDHPFEVAALNNSNAALDLGLIDEQGSVTPELDGTEDQANGDTIVGRRLLAGFETRMRNTLNGGSRLFRADGTAANDFAGVRNGLIEIQDREGDTVQIDLDKRNSTTITAVEGGGERIEVNDATGITEGSRIRITNGGTTEFKTVTEVGNLDMDGQTEIQFENQSLDPSLGVGDGVHSDKESLKDIVRSINNEAQDAGVNVSLSIDDEKNGLLLEDNTGSTANDLRIRDVDDGDGEADRAVQDMFGTAGAGSLADIQVSANQIDGTDRDPQYISTRTKLASLNGGEGVDRGKIEIKDRDGTTFTVDLRQSDDTHIRDVIREINLGASGAGSDLRANVNDTGDGIVLEDSTGSNKIRVRNAGGATTADDLNIAGEAPDGSPGRLDGSFEFKIDVTSSDTLEDVVDKINNSDVPLSANFVDDGSDNNPYRISLLSDRSGLPGRITADSTVPDLSFSTTAPAKDARMLFGTDGGDGEPALFTRSENRFEDIVDGLTVKPQSPSFDPVTVTVERDLQKVMDKASSFVEQYNKVIESIKEKTKFNLEEDEKGPLVGQNDIQSTERLLARTISQAVEGIPSSKLNTAGEAGFSLNKDGTLSLDSSKLRDQLESNFKQTRDFFTKQKQLELDLSLDRLNNGRGIDTGQNEDLEIFKRNGDSFTVDVSSANDVSDVLRLINTNGANGDDISMDIGADGNRFVITSSGPAHTDDVDSVSGSGSVLEDSALGGKSEEALVGARVEMTSGPNSGEVATVESFDESSNELTLSDPIATSGDDYELEAKVGAANENDTRTASTLGINSREEPGDTTVKGGIINVDGDPGFGPRGVDNMESLIRDSTGMLTGAKEGIEDEIEGLEEEIDDINEDIQAKKDRLTKRFARLEQFLAQQQRSLQRLQTSASSFSSGGFGGGGLQQLLGGGGGGGSL